MDKQELTFIYGVDGKLEFGSGGFVFLDDCMGTDHDIARIARTSYGAGTKTLSDDTALIRRLIKDYHTSPFEMARARFFLRAPIDVVRQLVRHRMLVHGSINEYSTRYSVAVDEMATVAPDQWRAQSTTNKQGSAGFVTEWPVDWELKYYKAHGHYATPGEYLTDRQSELQGLASVVYKERLDLGVAREQARMDLPLSNYTELYLSVDAHNLMSFLSLRLDPHAQQEIRELATHMERIFKDWLPVTHQAFLDYRVNAMTLSAQEQQLLLDLIAGDRPWMLVGFLDSEPADRAAHMAKFGITSLNERSSFVTKLRKLTEASDD